MKTINEDRLFEILSGDRKAWRDDYDRMPWKEFKARTYGVGTRLYFAGLGAYALLGAVLAVAANTIADMSPIQFWLAYMVAITITHTSQWWVTFGSKWWRP